MKKEPEKSNKRLEKIPKGRRLQFSSARKRKAVFLDRDGVINVDKAYVHKISDFEFIDGAVEAVGQLNKHGFAVVVITNQSGIGRGYYTEKDVEILHEHINKEMAKNQARIDAFYYCPHHPTAGIGNYRQMCRCRKPAIGLFEKAVNDFNVNVGKSYLIGDSSADIEAGKRLGLTTILVGNRSVAGPKPEFTADNVLTAVNLILGLTHGRSNRNPGEPL